MPLRARCARRSAWQRASASSRTARPTWIPIRTICADDHSCGAGSSTKRSPRSKAPSRAIRTSRRPGQCCRRRIARSLDYNGLARRTDVPLEEARSFVQSAHSTAANARPAVQSNWIRATTAVTPRLPRSWRRAVSGWKPTDLFAQAFAIDPNNPEALYRYGQMLNIVGRVADSLRAYEQLRALEPLVPIYQAQTASQMYIAGRNQAAIAILEGTPDDGPARFYRDLYLARAYAATGRFADAADAVSPCAASRRRAPRRSKPRPSSSACRVSANRRRACPRLAISISSTRTSAPRAVLLEARRAWLEGRQRDYAIDFLEPRVGPRRAGWSASRRSRATQVS